MTSSRRDRSRGPALAVSLTLHAAVLAAALAPAARDLAAPAVRTVEVRLLSAPMPSAAEPPAAASPPPRARPAPPRTPVAKPASSPVVPALEATPTALPAPAEVAASATATLPTAAATPPIAETEIARDPSPATVALAEPTVAGPAARSSPSLVDRAAPEYPWMSRRLREAGRVLLDIVVDVDGRAREVTVLQTSGHARLDEAAAAAARRWRFTPAREGGIAVVAQVRVPVLFDLVAGGSVDATLAAVR